MASTASCPIQDRAVRYRDTAFGQQLEHPPAGQRRGQVSADGAQAGIDRPAVATGGRSTVLGEAVAGIARVLLPTALTAVGALGHGLLARRTEWHRRVPHRTRRVPRLRARGLLLYDSEHLSRLVGLLAWPRVGSLPGGGLTFTGMSPRQTQAPCHSET